MRLAIRIFSILLLSFLTTCAVNDQESDGPVFCSIDQTEVYDVNTDPTVDFNETNITKTVTFNDTDCPQINNDPFNAFVSRVKREDSTLQIFERQYQASQFLLEMDIEGGNLTAVKNVQNANLCSVVRIWRGTLDTPANTITLNQTIEYKGACRSVFYNPDTDTTTPTN